MPRGRGNYPEVVSDLAGLGADDTGYARVGALCVAEDAEALAAIERVAARRAAAAPEAGEVKRVGSSLARELFPPLRQGLGAVLVSGGARVDGRRMTEALLGAARRFGAVQRSGKAELVAGGGRVRGVRLAGELVSCPRRLMPTAASESGRAGH